LKQIQFCLIRAKVDLEYGAGLNWNQFLKGAMEEIEKACDYAFYEEDANVCKS
jgi:hypothetical protein